MRPASRSCRAWSSASLLRISRRRPRRELSFSILTRASSAQPGRLDVKDPQAVSLGYVEDAARVDARKFPAYVKGSTCENCLQLQGTAGNPYRPCAAFKGKLVSIAGWCSAWTPEM